MLAGLEKSMRTHAAIESKLQAQSVCYLEPPRLGMLLAALKYQLILFVMFFFSNYPIAFFELLPLYGIVLYLYNSFFTLCTKFGYKRYMLYMVAGLLNLPSCVVASYLYRLVIGFFR